MHRNHRLVVLLLGALAPALAACGSAAGPPPAASTSPATSSATSPDTSSNTSSSASAGTASETGAATVKVASSSLGEIVVDAQGRTLYMFTKDTKGAGTSACTGQCLSAWPPLLTSGAPRADGVAGTLGTIGASSGKQQVTLNGWPLYYFAKDAAPGDVKGQGVNSVWFVLDRAGEPVTGSPTATTGSRSSPMGY